MFQLPIFLSRWTSFVRDEDFCPLICLIGLLLYLGRFAVAHSPRLQLIGFRIAAGASLLHALTDIAVDGFATPGELVAMILRAVGAGLILLGFGWIALSALSVAWDSMRRLVSGLRLWIDRWKTARRRRREAARQQEQQRRAALEWERTRPQRDQAARDAAERARHEAAALSQAAAQQASERKRREDARFQVLVLYDRRAAGFGERIPRQRVLGYLDRYLGDDVSLDLVEERATQLTQLLQETSRGGRPQLALQSLENIAATFQKRRDEIAALPYDAETKESLLCAISTQEEAAVRELLRP